MTPSGLADEKTRPIEPGGESATGRGFGARLGLLWLTVVLPFGILPVLFLREDSKWADHGLFHFLYIPVIIAALYIARQMAARAPSRALRFLSWLVIGTQAVALVGHLGEQSVVLTHSSTPEHEVFDLAGHMFFANFSVFGLMASILAVLATTIFFGVRVLLLRRSADRLA